MTVSVFRPAMARSRAALALPLLASVAVVASASAHAETRAAKAERKAHAEAAAPAMPTDRAPAKPVVVAKRGAKTVPSAVPPALPAASPEQVDAAGRVYYGIYDCEFKQSIDVAASKTHPSYVDLKLSKGGYLMKPVLSSTGAVRLEDVRGELLMVQIASKSMLLNVKTAQRIVDDCITQKQRELIEAARIARTQAERAAATAALAAAPQTPAGPAVEPPTASASAAAATPAIRP